MTVYLLFFISSLTSFAVDIQVDLTGETCIMPEVISGDLVFETHTYTGVIVEAPWTIKCGTPFWEYDVEGGQIVSIIKPNGLVVVLSTPQPFISGSGFDVDQVNIQWLDNNSCNSVKFTGITTGDGIFCSENRDSKTLFVNVNFNPIFTGVDIDGPSEISCGENQFSFVVLEGCNAYDSYEWTISDGPTVTTTSPEVQLMVNDCPGSFEVSVTASGCGTVYFEKTFTCSGQGSPELVIDLEKTYCCKKDILMNTDGTSGVDGHFISICQIDAPGSQNCINYRSTGWIQGGVDPEIDLLDIWNNGGSSNWIFWPGYFYRISLAAYNECTEWISVSETFEVLSIDPYFEINDVNGNTVPNNGSVCKSLRDVTMDASGSSCGDEYNIMICQINPNGGDCLNWRSTGWIEGDVSSEGEIDLLDIWNNNGQSSWLFWSNNTFRVSLVLRDECDDWESYNQTFTVDGDCFTGGSGGDNRNTQPVSGVDTRNSWSPEYGTNKAMKIFPTLINASTNYLTVIVPEIASNSNLIIYNVNGKVIQENAIVNQSTEVAIPNLANGIYFAVFYENGKPKGQSKLVFSN